MPAKMDDCSKSFETILCLSGKFGPYQKRLYAVTSIMHVVCASVLMYRTFLPWQEVKEDCTEELVPTYNLSFLFMDINETVTFSTTCRKYFVNEIGLEADWVLPEWTFPDFQPDIKWLQLYSQAIGLVVGLLLGSFLADLLGRRRIMFVAFGFMCLIQCGLGFVPDWRYFLGCLCLVGLGAGCFIVSSMVLVLEYVGHDWRDVCICFIPWWTGPVLLAIEAYFTRHWRYLAVLSGAIGLPLLGAYLFLGAMVYSGFQCRVNKLIDNPYLDNLTVYGTDVIVIFTAICINKCIGRRWTLFLFSMSSGLISMCILVLHVTNESDIDESMIRALAFFTKLGITTSLTMMNLVVMEIYPTVVRCMGCAVGLTAGIGGYLLAENLNVYLEPFHYTVPFLVHGGMMCVFAIIVLVFPETIRRPLPDILKCRHRILCSHEPLRLSNGWVT